MSNTDQNSEILSLLRLVLTQVNTLTSDLQEVKTSQQALATSQQALATSQQALVASQQALVAEVQEVKADVREIKSWSRVKDNQLENLENKLVGFATQLSNLDEKVDARLQDTRPMWNALNLRLNAIETEIASIKDNQSKSQQTIEEFRQEILLKVQGLEKDLRIFQRHIQVDVLSFAKDTALFEERLQKIESKIEPKN